MLTHSCSSFISMRAFTVFIALVGLVGSAAAKPRMKDDLYCSVCEHMTDSIEESLLKVHSTSTIPVDHRTDAKGFYKSIRYQRSETRIIEILEEVCEGLRGSASWATQTNDDGTREYVDVNKGGSFSSISMNRDVTDEIIFACHYMLEEYDEEITSYLWNNYEEDLKMHKNVCHDIVGTCQHKEYSDDESDEGGSDKEEL